MRFMIALLAAILFSGPAFASCYTKSFTNEADYIACVGVSPYTVAGSAVDGAATTGDPHSRYQWAMRQLFEGDSYSTHYADAPRDVIVAVFDNQGPGNAHADLTGKILTGWNFVTATSVTTNTWDGLAPASGNGHGLCLTSIIAANHDEIGMAGVFDRAKILPVVTDLANLDEAIDYAVSEGAEVIDIGGWATTYSGGVSVDEFYYYMNDLYVPYGSRKAFLLTSDRDLYSGYFRDIRRALRDAERAGVAVVAPIGNTNGRAMQHFLASRSEVIAVSASNINGEVSPFNSINLSVQTFAPGGDRRTTSFPLTLPGDITAYDPISSNGDDPLCATGTNTYSFGAGSSFAHPYVAGAIAIIKSYQPTATTADVRCYLSKATNNPTPNMNVLQGVAGVLSLKKLRPLLNAACS